MARFSLALFSAVVVAACGTALGIERAAVTRASTTRVPKAAATSEPVPPRAVARPPTPFATVDGVALVHPADRVERVGFHQASDVATLDLEVLGSAIRPKVLPSRSRPTSARSAVDIVVDPRSEIRAPVSGIVKRAGGYRLYCKYPDGFVVISPDGHPELEVKALHISGVRVRPGDRVVAGKTLLAKHATRFPFRSQVDAFTADPAWPHVHMEVTQLDVPDARPQFGKSLTLGCP